MQEQSDICVIGDGAIGKAAALGLARAGLSVTLLRQREQAATQIVPDTPWDLRVYALNRDARRLLTSLKVWDAMDHARIAAVDAMKIHGDGEQQGGRLSFDAYGARADALAWIVEDANLNQALEAALRFSPNLRIANGRATALRITERQAQITLDNGQALSASLVVGADGAHSWVRAQCDIDIDYRTYGQRAIVTNFACEKPHHGAAFQWFTGSEGIVALLPLPGQRVSLVWSAPEALADTLMQESAEQIAQRLAAWCHDELGRLQPLPPASCKAFPLALIRARDITAPRVALAGDAAHLVHPLAGQGMNLGFGDVIALIDVIGRREPHRDPGDERVLGRYARARKEDILLMQVATDGLQRLFDSDFEPLRLARNFGMNLVDRVPFIKRQLISQALGRLL